MAKKEQEGSFDDEEVSDVVDPIESSKPENLRILEALLFASDELMDVARIKAILPGQPDARKIRAMVEKINVQLQKERHPFEIVEIGGGYQFRTIAFYHQWVRQIFKEKSIKKLSIQALECLAIIAYKQPISKAEIEAVRGVVSDGAMKTLLEKRLATITGRSEKPGRPLLYGTTHTFLTYFGLNKIDDLPRIEEFEALAREKMDELSLDELAAPEVMESETVFDHAISSDEETHDDTSTFEVALDESERVTAAIKESIPAEVTDDGVVLTRDKEGAESLSDNISGATVLDLSIKETDSVGGERNVSSSPDDKAEAEITKKDAPPPDEGEFDVVEKKTDDGSFDHSPVSVSSANATVNTASEEATVFDISVNPEKKESTSYDGATVFDASLASVTENTTDSTEGEDDVFEVDGAGKDVTRFSNDDLEMLGGAMMETRAIHPEKIDKKKKKGRGNSNADDTLPDEKKSTDTENKP